MKYFKLILIVNLLISLGLFIISFFTSTLKQPFQNIKAINSNNLILDTVDVKSIKYNFVSNDVNNTNEQFYEFYLVLTKNGKEQNIIYNQNLYNLENNIIDNGKNKRIVLLRNSVNNNLFLNDSKYLSKIQRSNYLKIYFYISGILILIFFTRIIILKKNVKK